MWSGARSRCNPRNGRVVWPIRRFTVRFLPEVPRGLIGASCPSFLPSSCPTKLISSTPTIATVSPATLLRCLHLPACHRPALCSLYFLSSLSILSLPAFSHNSKRSWAWDRSVTQVIILRFSRNVASWSNAECHYRARCARRGSRPPQQDFHQEHVDLSEGDGSRTKLRYI